MAVNQQQLDYLGAIGIPVWVSRDLPMPEMQDMHPRLSSANGRLAKRSIDDVISVTKSSVPNIDRTIASPKKGLQAADELIKDLQQTPIQQIAELAASLDGDISPESQVVSKDLVGVGWVELEDAVNQCTACDLHEKRQHPVFGKGSQQPSLMIVGDIPRLLDEQKKQPFTGEAGELLDNMVSHLGIKSDAVYYTNLLKCRPPLDGSPQPNQSASCLSYLKQQIKLLKPQLVLLMGRSTAQQVLGQDQAMSQLRQKQHELQGLDSCFVVTYHPTYLLRQPRLKSLVWQDLQFTKRVLTEHG